MLGAIIIAVVIIVVIPVGVLMSGGAGAAGISTLLRLDRKAEHEGSELDGLL